MPKYEYSESVPENIEDLKKMAMNKTSYRTRNEAIETLKNYKCRQSIDVLWRLMINDKVYSVQHQAFLALQNFGEDVKLPRKKKGNLVKDINKKLGKVPTHIAVIVALLSTMKDDGVDFYPILEKISSYKANS